MNATTAISIRIFQENGTASLGSATKEKVVENRIADIHALSCIETKQDRNIKRATAPRKSVITTFLINIFSNVKVSGAEPRFSAERPS